MPLLARLGSLLGSLRGHAAERVHRILDGKHEGLDNRCQRLRPAGDENDLFKRLLAVMLISANLGVLWEDLKDLILARVLPHGIGV